MNSEGFGGILKRTFVKDQGLMTRSIAGEMLVVPIKNQVGDLDSIYTLNEVGSRVWQLIDPKTQVEEIVQVICTEYEVNAEEASEDITGLLVAMEEAGLIRSADEG